MIPVIPLPTPRECQDCNQLLNCKSNRLFKTVLELLAETKETQSANPSIPGQEVAALNSRVQGLVSNLVAVAAELLLASQQLDGAAKADGVVT